MGLGTGVREHCSRMQAAGPGWREEWATVHSIIDHPICLLTLDYDELSWLLVQ